MVQKNCEFSFIFGFPWKSDAQVVIIWKCVALQAAAHKLYKSLKMPCLWLFVCVRVRACVCILETLQLIYSFMRILFERLEQRSRLIRYSQRVCT